MVLAVLRNVLLVEADAVALLALVVVHPELVWELHLLVCYRERRAGGGKRIFNVLVFAEDERNLVPLHRNDVEPVEHLRHGYRVAHIKRCLLLHRRKPLIANRLVLFRIAPPWPGLYDFGGIPLKPRRNALLVVFIAGLEKPVKFLVHRPIDDGALPVDMPKRNLVASCQPFRLVEPGVHLLEELAVEIGLRNLLAPFKVVEILRHRLRRRAVVGGHELIRQRLYRLVRVLAHLEKQPVLQRRKASENRLLVLAIVVSRAVFMAEANLSLDVSALLDERIERPLESAPVRPDAKGLRVLRPVLKIARLRRPLDERVEYPGAAEPDDHVLVRDNGLRRVGHIRIGECANLDFRIFRVHAPSHIVAEVDVWPRIRPFALRHRRARFAHALVAAGAVRLREVVDDRSGVRRPRLPRAVLLDVLDHLLGHQLAHLRVCQAQRLARLPLCRGRLDAEKLRMGLANLIYIFRERVDSAGRTLGNTNGKSSVARLLVPEKPHLVGRLLRPHAHVEEEIRA